MKMIEVKPALGSLSVPIAAIALAVGLSFLTGCEREGPAERAAEDVGEALEDTADRLEEAADEID